MIEAESQLRVAEMRDQHHACGAQGVADNRQDDRERRERQACPPAPEEQIREQKTDRERGQEEAETSARFGDVKRGARDMDQQAVQPGRDADELERSDGKARRELLERRDQAVADGHREIQVEQGKRQQAEGGRPDDRERRRLEQGNQRELLDGQRRDHLADGGHQRRAADQDQAQGPGPRRRLPQGSRWRHTSQATTGGTSMP